MLQITQAGIGQNRTDRSHKDIKVRKWAGDNSGLVLYAIVDKCATSKKQTWKLKAFAAPFQYAICKVQFRIIFNFHPPGTFYIPYQEA